MGCALSAAAAPALSSAAARFSARLRKASWTAFFRTFASSAPFASLDAANGNGAGGGAARRKGGAGGGAATGGGASGGGASATNGDLGTRGAAAGESSGVGKSPVNLLRRASSAERR